MHKAGYQNIIISMEILITSSFDAKLSVLNNSLVLRSGECAQLVTDNDSNCLLGVEPINDLQGNYSLPYCVRLDKDSQTLCDSEFCQTYIVDDIIHLHLLQKTLVRTQLYASINYNQKRYTLIQNGFDKSVAIYGGEKEIKLDVDFVVFHYNYYVKTITNAQYLFLEMTGQNRSYLMFAKDITEPIFAGEVDSYEWNDNVISVAKKYIGELQLLRIKKYSFDSDCKLIEDTAGMLSDTLENKEPSITPYLFLEAARAGCIDLLKQFSSEEFGSMIEKNVLENFFPDFDDFAQLSFSIYASERIVLTKKGRHMAILNFEMKDGKVTNIISSSC